MMAIISNNPRRGYHNFPLSTVNWSEATNTNLHFTRVYPDCTTPVNRAMPLKYEKLSKSNYFPVFSWKSSFSLCCLFLPQYDMLFLTENEETPNKSSSAADKKAHRPGGLFAASSERGKYYAGKLSELQSDAPGTDHPDAP